MPYVDETRDIESSVIESNTATIDQHAPKRYVLLLADFYQHPLAITHYLRYLTKHGFQVVCPYLGDIINKCAEQTDLD